LNPGLIYALLSFSTVMKVNTKPIDCPSYVILLINVTMVMKHYHLKCGVLFYHYNVLEIKTFRFVLRECVRNLDLQVQVHPGELWVSKQRVHIVLEASKSAGAKDDVPKICGFVYPLHPC
jgi:hypothetical protein